MPIAPHSWFLKRQAVELDVEALRIAGLGEERPGLLGIVRQTGVELCRPADAFRPDQHAGGHAEAVGCLEDAPDIHPLVDRLAHAPVSEGIAPLDIRGPQLGARLVEADVKSLIALGLQDFQARRRGDLLELVPGGA